MEAHEAEEGANELAEEAQEGENVEKELREQEFCVPHWESHDEVLFVDIV